MEKKSVAVIFGGISSEHEVSCVSAITIITNMNPDHYDVTMIGITKDGRWLLADSIEDIRSGEWRKSRVTAIISPDRGQKAILLIENGKVEMRRIDAAFPALHGLYGEDGTIQGMFELAGIPYVGCGVLSSAVSMDKMFTKLIVNTLGIRQAKYVPVSVTEFPRMEEIADRIEKEIPYPIFVKPANAGSSRGITKAHNRKELIQGLKTAGSHDCKILAEETIVGREVECAVLGGADPKVSGVGEILSAAEFYDYDAKYHNEESKTVLSPVFPEGTTDRIREYALRIFRAVDGYGIARVDFFVEDGTGDVVFNEINTLPGFTEISMYPMLWEAEGIPKQELVECLIRSAFARKRQEEERCPVIHQ